MSTGWVIGSSAAAAASAHGGHCCGAPPEIVVGIFAAVCFAFGLGILLGATHKRS